MLKTRKSELFRGVVPFVAVAEARSFHGAARALGVSTAAVSKAVRSLEASLGVVLIHRTARFVDLTREGALFHERARAAVAEVEGAREALARARRVPEGELTLSLPFVLTNLVARGIALLRARHPRLTFKLLVTDRLSKLASESVDVAVRIGDLPDSTLVSRVLRKTELLTIASPAYLARAGTPAKVADLDRHDCVGLIAPSGKPYAWLFKSGPREVRSIALPDHGPLSVEAVVAGVGIGQAFDFMLGERLARGELIEILPDERAQGPAITAVCAPGQRATPRVRAAFEAFADAFARATG
jgi:DNA-binding transcriptional LysR family regulator